MSSGPILERMSRWQYWVIDQNLHFLAGAAITAAVCFLASALNWTEWVSIPHWATIPVALFVSQRGCFRREIRQQWGDKPSPGSTEDTIIDTEFWGWGSYAGLPTLPLWVWLLG